MKTSGDPFELAGEALEGKYRIGELVGEGGFGVVYRGTHEGFDAPIAIKCLKLPPHLTPRAREALVAQHRDEGKLLLKLSQRTTGIVQALDVGSFTGPDGKETPFLVLEWLEGRTLASLIRERRAEGRAPWSMREAVKLLEPAARALGIAHAERIAHRDIKPENIMVIDGPKGQTLKILDFGIAKVLEGAASFDASETGAGPSAFTPGYGAPEQFEKKRGATGPWTDVFALALVYVELVSGRPALAGSEMVELYHSATDPVSRPTLRRVGVAAPRAVEDVLARALSVEPGARFANADELWDALTAACESSEDAVATAPAAPLADDASLSTQEFLSRQEESRGREPSEEPALASAPTERATTRSAVVTPEAPPPPSKTARPIPWWMGAAALAVVGVTAVALRSRDNATEKISPSASASSSANAIRRTGPVSTLPEADALYREALAAWRDGSPDAAVRTMTKAAALDRDLAAAQLRLAIWKFRRRPADAREHFDAASRHAESLSANDRALLDAAAPLMAVPSDLEAFEKRLTAITDGRPDDVEVWGYLAAARLRRLRYDEALDAVHRALALDSGSVGAWVLEADVLSKRGDVEGQLVAYAGCLKGSPRAVECLSKQVSLRAVTGHCHEMLEDAKRLVAMSGNTAMAHRFLAVALDATGASRESVLAALEKSWTLSSASERPAVEAADRESLALLDGDFTQSATFLSNWSRAVEGAPDQNTHARPALESIRVAFEMGNPKDGSGAADAFLRRMGAWTEPTDGDWTLTFQRYRWLAGDLPAADLDRVRGAWITKIHSQWELDGRRPDRELEWTVWSSTEAAFARDEATARAAVDKMPSDATPMASGRFANIDLNLGEVLSRAGRAADAIAPLERVANRCTTLGDPLLALEAHYELGRAYEGTGQTERARAAYEWVVARWGRATPRSTTAEAAKARLAALPAAPPKAP